jgi:hypothetical protein
MLTRVALIVPAMAMLIAGCAGPLGFSNAAPPVTDVPTDRGCLYGRFKAIKAPLDLPLDFGFGLVLKENQSRQEHTISFNKSGDVNVFSLPEGTYSISAMASNVGGQVRKVAIADPKLTGDIRLDPTTCKYLGDFVGLVSLSSLETRYFAPQAGPAFVPQVISSTPYSWRLMSVEENFDLATQSVSIAKLGLGRTFVSVIDRGSKAIGGRP